MRWGLTTARSNCPGSDPSAPESAKTSKPCRLAQGCGQRRRAWSYPASHGTWGFIYPVSFLRERLLSIAFANNLNDVPLVWQQEDNYGRSLELVVIQQSDSSWTAPSINAITSFVANLAATLTQFDKTVFLKGKTVSKLLANVFYSPAISSLRIYLVFLKATCFIKKPLPKYRR